MDFYCLALIFLTISTTVGAINFIVVDFSSACSRHDHQPHAAISVQHADDLVSPS